MRVLFISCYLLISKFIIGQIPQIHYQSNPSLGFAAFLSGVKNAYIAIDETGIQFIIDNPSSGNAKAIVGLMRYLKEIGFGDVNWGTINNRPVLTSICDQVIISPSWEIKNNSFTNLTLSFQSCKGDIFTFKYSKSISNSSFNNVSNLFYYAFTKMYGYNKPDYQLKNKLSLPINLSKWNEISLKDHYMKNGFDSFEGIYENSKGEINNPKYKIGIVKNNDGYDLIYIAGAKNYEDWKPGEIKGKLYPTATSTLFKTDWYMNDKSLSNSPFVSFNQGSMELIIQGYDKEIFIKLYPPSVENKNSNFTDVSYGTGFAITSNGFIVTNHHVVNEANSIKVKGLNGDFSKTLNARIVIEDKNNDLAIIKIDDSNFKSIGSIPFFINSKTIDVGNSIFVLGFPLRATMGDEIKLTNGIISSKSGFQGDITSYQITAPIQPGNSGGPVFDEKGNLVGIINAKHKGAENVSYAIKTTYLYNLMESIDIPPSPLTPNSLSGKPLTELVKILNKYVYILEVD